MGYIASQWAAGFIRGFFLIGHIGGKPMAQTHNSQTPSPQGLNVGINSKIVVLEVGRPITQDIRQQLGEPYIVVSVTRQVSADEIPSIAIQAYRAIAEAASGGHEVHLILSGPLPLAFMIGQLVGLSHYRIVTYMFVNGRYVRVPPPTREMLFR